MDVFYYILYTNICSLSHRNQKNGILQQTHTHRDHYNEFETLKSYYRSPKLEENCNKCGLITFSIYIDIILLIITYESDPSFVHTQENGTKKERSNKRDLFSNKKVNSHEECKSKESNLCYGIYESVKVILFVSCFWFGLFGEITCHVV